MYDTHFGRETVHLIYNIRWFLILLCMLTFILAFMFRTPLDRVYIMILELQIMCNFAIFHVCLPGNVEISSQVMKTFVSFNFMKDITYSLFGKEQSKDDAEEELAFLGQRSTYNYNSFNLMFNMETLGIIFFLYLVKIFIVWCFYMYNKHGKNQKAKKVTVHYHARLLDQVIYNDLLNLFIRFFLEFGIATFIVFQAPVSSIDLSFINIFMTIMVVSAIFIGVPLVYWLIYKETMINNLRYLTFKEKFGHSLLGAKIHLGHGMGVREKRSYFFMHIVSFIAVRLGFLIIAFMTSVQWVHIFLLLTLFMINTCRVAITRPMFGKWNNFLAIFNQFSLVVCVYHLFCFTDWLEPDEQYLCGFSFLITVAIFIIVNLLYIVIDLFRYIKYLILSYWPHLFIYINILIKMIGGCYDKLRSLLMQALGFLMWLLHTAIYYIRFGFNWVVERIILLLRLNSPKFSMADVDVDVEAPPGPPRPMMDMVDQDNDAELPEPVLLEKPIPPPPPPPPPEPTVEKLQLVRGVWTKVIVKIS
jgi:hypothetical protein